MEAGMTDGAGTTEPVDDWIDQAYCPTAPGLRPWPVTILGLAAANIVFIMYPANWVFLALSAVLLFLTVGITLRGRVESDSDGYGLAIILPAAIAFGWAYWIWPDPMSGGAALPHATLAAGVITLGVASGLRESRFAFAAVSDRAAGWNEEGMALYAEFLLDQRPVAGSSGIARELYRRASQRALDRPWSRAPRAAIMVRYAVLLEDGIGGAADPDAADWWTLAAGNDHNGPFHSAGPGALDQGHAALDATTAPPTWRLLLPDAAVHKAPQASVAFHAFKLPEAGLLACAIELRSGKEPSTVVHRVFDVSDMEAEAYLAALEHHLSWRIEVHRKSDTGAARVYEISLKDTGFMEAVEAAITHNIALGPAHDGDSAMSFVATKLEALATEDGIEATWAAIEAACPPDQETGAPRANR